MADGVGKATYDASLWLDWRAASDRLSEEELCAAVREGRLALRVIVSETDYTRVGAGVPVRTAVEPVLSEDFGPHWLVEGTSAPALYHEGIYGRDHLLIPGARLRPRWKRADGKAWPHYGSSFRVVAWKQGVEQLLARTPLAPVRKRRPKRGTPRETCKRLITQEYPDGIPAAESDKDIIFKIRERMARLRLSWSDMTILRAAERRD